MRIKQKFFLLAGIVGAVIIVISAIGYNTAADAVEQSAQKELMADIIAQSDEAESWLASKAQYAISTAEVLSNIPDTATTRRPEILSGILADKEFQDAYHVQEDGWAWAYVAGDLNGKREWRERQWYIDIKREDRFLYTDPYIDAMTGKLVVSATMPYSRQTGLGGGLCYDIKMDAIQDHVGKIKFNGEGVGYILNPKNDLINVSADASQNLKKISENPLLKNKISEMVQKKSGFFTVTVDGNERLVAYHTMGLTGWITAIELPPLSSFGDVSKLRYLYIGLTAVGVVLLVSSLLYFANGVVRRISALNHGLHEIADGNLSADDLAVDSSDEFGEMARQFNAMKRNIYGVIVKMTDSSERVAASSEALSSSSHQAALNATQVAGTVSEVADGMNKQLDTVEETKRSIDRAFGDIERMADKASGVAESTLQMTAAAEKGSALMQTAISTMCGIEESVSTSAAVVRKLGENSHEIGQIAETISHISGQTDLLALNAAIEAARAGEAGRGFAVVAEEVKKLAEQSSIASESISKLISDVQRDTEEAVVSMEKGAREVSSGMQSVRAVSEQFDEINRRVSAVNCEMGEIKSSADEIRAGMETIIKAVVDIDDVSRGGVKNAQVISSAAEEQSASSQEIASASHSLSDLAVELRAAAGAFKI